MTEARVLVQVNNLELGGTQLNAVDFARGLKAHGFHSILFGPLDSLPVGGPSLLDVAKEREVELRTFHRPTSILFGGAQEMRSRADMMAADIVHVYGTWGGQRAAYWGPCRAGVRPLVQTAYEMSLDSSLYRHTSLIVGTQYLLEQERGRRPGPTSLVSPPVDLDQDVYDAESSHRFRDPIGADQGQVLMVIVSRLDKELKALSVETAIRSMRHLSDCGVMLAVVGTGPMESELLELARTENAAAGRKVVHLVGPLSDPRPAYSAADIVLGMGGSAARALAFGKPLIVQGEFGTSELFDNRSAPSLFRRSFWNPRPQENASVHLAMQVRELVGDPERRAELGRFGREFAVANFGLDAMTARVAEVYEDSLRSYRLPEWTRDLPHEMRAVGQAVATRLRASRSRVRSRRDPGKGTQ